MPFAFAPILEVPHHVSIHRAIEAVNARGFLQYERSIYGIVYQ